MSSENNQNSTFDKRYIPEPLNRIKYSVRASQAIMQYGVGAMVDFADQTLMTAAPYTWKNTCQIHDERLEKLLDVTHFEGFSTPIDKKFPTVSYVRFPAWYFCPKCRRFKPISEWVSEHKKLASSKAKEYDPHMIKNVICPTCRIPLVVSRLVTICEHGHIDDFPWIKWVHYRSKKKICQNPGLTISTSSSEGLEGISVKCSCNAFATLAGAFDKKVFERIDDENNSEYDFSCTGFHPWKNIHEKCSAHPRTSQRGSSSVYFPFMYSSIVIPPYSGIQTKQVESSRHYGRCKEAVAEILEDSRVFHESQSKTQEKIKMRISKFSELISQEIGVLDEETVRGILERRILSGDDNMEESTAGVKYKYDEYTALNGSVKSGYDSGSDFICEYTDASLYPIPHIKAISLIHKLREVKALVGFSRCKPEERSISIKKSENLVSVKSDSMDWYPAYQVYGEGIFIEFDNAAIESWLRKNSLASKHAMIVGHNYRISFIGKNYNRSISAKYLLLHTISHMLIKQLSFECGYSISSLQERIYCSDKDSDGFDMQGILIYTASGDSEGTLGGLVRQGRPDTFPAIFKKAMESAMICSNDPVCSLSNGQGRDNLNLAACYSCTLIPETSCEENNVFLDRSTLVGTFDDRQCGFWSPQLYNGASWESTAAETNNAVVEISSPTISFTNGIKYDDLSYKEIFSGLLSDAEPSEKPLIKALKDSSESLDNKVSKPVGDSKFLISSSPDEEFSCDLVWQDKKVMLFLSYNEEAYSAAKKSDWTCFFTGDTNITADSIISKLTEEQS